MRTEVVDDIHSHEELTLLEADTSCLTLSTKEGALKNILVGGIGWGTRVMKVQ